MSKVYRCDRCGEIFDKDRRNLFRYHLTKYTDSKEISLDLCDNCEESLVDWINEFKKEENENGQ